MTTQQHKFTCPACGTVAWLALLEPNTGTRYECACGKAAFQIDKLLDGRLRFTIEGVKGAITSFDDGPPSLSDLSLDKTGGVAHEKLRQLREDAKERIVEQFSIPPDMFEVVCDECAGEGTMGEAPCGSCDGKGRVARPDSNRGTIAMAAGLDVDKMMAAAEHVDERTKAALRAAFTPATRTPRSWEGGMKAAARYQRSPYIAPEVQTGRKGQHREVRHRPVARFARAARGVRLPTCDWCGEWTSTVLRNEKSHTRRRFSLDARGKVAVHMVCAEAAFDVQRADMTTRAFIHDLAVHAVRAAHGAWAGEPSLTKSAALPRRAWRMVTAARELLDLNPRITISDVRIYRKLAAAQERARQEVPGRARDWRITKLMAQPTLPYVISTSAGKTRVTLTRPSTYIGADGVEVLGQVHYEWMLAAQHEEHRERARRKAARRLEQSTRNAARIRAALANRIDAYEVCGECKGEGFVNLPDIGWVGFSSLCVTCKGKGVLMKAATPRPSRPCPSCDGDGQATSKFGKINAPCATCCGRGVVEGAMGYTP
jgi:hypothetical protein